MIFFFVGFYVCKFPSAAILFFWLENSKLHSGVMESAYTGSQEPIAKSSGILCQLLSTAVLKN